MLLAFDVGNTNTLVGLCRPDSDPIDPAGILATWRVSSLPTRMPDEWLALLAPLLRAEGYRLADVTGVVIGSVVPDVRRWLGEMTRSRLGFEPVVVSAAIATGIRVATERPLATGADRIANAVAARLIAGAPAIVVDFGTATNIEVVDAAGDLVGGAIAPGAAMMLDALTSRAAQLQTVALQMPPTVGIGRDTAAAVQSGSVAGYLDLIEGTVRRIRAELGVEAPVLTTGGMAGVFVAHSAVLGRYVPMLTLFGLRAVAARHEPPASSHRGGPARPDAPEPELTFSDVIMIE